MESIRANQKLKFFSGLRLTNVTTACYIEGMKEVGLTLDGLPIAR